MKYHLRLFNLNVWEIGMVRTIEIILYRHHGSISRVVVYRRKFLWREPVCGTHSSKSLRSPPKNPYTFIVIYLSIYTAGSRTTLWLLIFSPLQNVLVGRDIMIESLLRYSRRRHCVHPASHIRRPLSFCRIRAWNQDGPRLERGHPKSA